MLTQQLKSMTDGLWYISESDYPIETLEISEDSQNALNTLEDILKLVCPETTEWEKIELDYFFRNSIRKDQWMGEEEIASANRFQELLDFLHYNCSEVSVFRVGNIKIDCYIIGKTNEGKAIAMKTTAVET